ncbi:MAG: hypothetical protein CFH30_00531 [Alphaproteobacteria bacterium MarineAlpha8_Bin1]|nr:MAG: hypothetical protein CFH30_00531 [Alphaproteobacteria bacterium MarineAlpha8_Bin1]|tara:strand:- start:749 stop:1471 length:723 start_codon:yes stop_codon:yes gene_type:complete
MKTLVILIILTFSLKVNGHHKIYSPVVEEGRQSLEWRGHLDIDDTIEKNKSHHHVFETEYSWTSFWQSELEFHVSDKSDTTLDWEKTEFQNQLQIFDLDNYAGALYFSYNFVSEKDEADEIEYKYLNEISFNSFKLVTNFIFEKQVGTNVNKSTEFAFSNYLVFDDLLPYDLSFGFIGFSEMGEISNFNVFGEQSHQYGFQIEREIELEEFELEFAIAWLYGITDVSADNSILWNIEFEF